MYQTIIQLIKWKDNTKGKVMLFSQ